MSGGKWQSKTAHRLVFVARVGPLLKKERITAHRLAFVARVGPLLKKERIMAHQLVFVARWALLWWWTHRGGDGGGQDVLKNPSDSRFGRGRGSVCGGGGSRMVSSKNKKASWL
jgi:hypothetical protein